MGQTKQPKILIVEDNVHNHDLYKDAFERIGFEVVITPNADGYFIDMVNELRPDIISMDLMIGNSGAVAEREGLEAIELLKNDLRTHDIPIIVLSNFFEEGKVRRAKELGAVDYINLGGHTMSKIPEYYKKYLDDPKHYKPAHELMR
jgi:CheY-like chemotaxis protein